MAYNEVMKFSPYEYHEFPKWIQTGEKDGKPVGVIVHDEDEEVEARATMAPPAREADERARLILLAETKGVQVDKRWSIDRLSKTIEKAGFDPAFDPTA